MTDNIELSGVDLFIESLIEFTQDDKLQWSYKAPKEASYIKNAENAVFFVEYESKTLALAKTRNKGRRLRDSSVFSIISPQYETYEFITVELMVVDEEKSLVLWEPFFIS